MLGLIKFVVQLLYRNCVLLYSLDNDQTISESLTLFYRNAWMLNFTHLFPSLFNSLLLYFPIQDRNYDLSSLFFAERIPHSLSGLPISVRVTLQLLISLSPFFPLNNHWKSCKQKQWKSKYSARKPKYQTISFFSLNFIPRTHIDLTWTLMIR